MLPALLADAKFGEDLAEHVLDIDVTGEASEVAGSDSKLLSLQLRRCRNIAEADEGISCGLQLDPVAGAGHERATAAGI